SGFDGLRHSICLRRRQCIPARDAMRVPHACGYPIRVHESARSIVARSTAPHRPSRNSATSLLTIRATPIVALQIVEYASDDRGIGMLTPPGIANNQPESPRRHGVRLGGQFRITKRINQHRLTVFPLPRNLRLNVAITTD